jgi:hypothetical protein
VDTKIRTRLEDEVLHLAAEIDAAEISIISELVRLRKDLSSFEKHVEALHFDDFRADVAIALERHAARRSVALSSLFALIEAQHGPEAFAAFRGALFADL